MRTQQSGVGPASAAARPPPPPVAAAVPAGPARPPGGIPPRDDPLLQLRPEVRRQLEGGLKCESSDS